MYIGEKHVPRIAIGLGQLRTKLFKYVQVRLEGGALGQIGAIATPPKERLSCFAFEPGHIDAVLSKQVNMLFGEIVAVLSISLFEDDLKSKLVVTVLFGLLVGIFFFTIILFDYPFTGEFVVSPNAFRHALLNW